jgi:hypothetical protein
VDSSIYDFSRIPEECVVRDLRSRRGEKDPHPYLSLNGGKEFASLFSFAKRDSPIHCEIVDIRKPSKTIICTYDHQPRLFVPQRNRSGTYLRMFTPDELK